MFRTSEEHRAAALAKAQDAAYRNESLHNMKDLPLLRDSECKWLSKRTMYSYDLIRRAFPRRCEKCNCLVWVQGATTCGAH